MSKANAEDIKRESRGLRGQIPEVLADPGQTHFEDAENLLLKFHGTYQQDDRDLRGQLVKEKKEKAWQFMVRSKMPGGRLTAEQYLIHDRLGDSLANGSLRLTTRQGIQLHGVLKGSLKEVIATVSRSGLTTMGACGDVVRNTMGPAAALNDAAHLDAQQLAREISPRFLWRSSAYADIWLDGEKVELLAHANQPPEAEDPIYGKVYLPRKFKMGVAVEPRNDVDVFSQDIGFVPHVVNGTVEGYSVFVGGGSGMTHGQTQTHPALAKPLSYVRRADVMDVTVAIVTTQRDFGNREDRKQARMKYLIEQRGIDWFRGEVQRRVPHVVFESVKGVRFDTVEDQLGWHAQGDGRLFCGVHISMGRVADRPDGPAYKSAFRKIVETLRCPVIITPNTNLVFADIDPKDKASVDAILGAHRVPEAGGMTAARRVAHACVALPTCGLSLSESERVFHGVMDKIDNHLRELGLAEEPILFRMTGCPNGCARPYHSDIGFVGRAPNKYAMYVGGSIRGDRLAGLEKKVVTLEEIPGLVRGLLDEFCAGRINGELFCDWVARSRDLGPAPQPDHFHVELAERTAKLAAAKANGIGAAVFTDA
ncbi:MAG: NADPH-dependent assimilatory sulfite reductase hemoprotein subunit [Verrucomicrobiales bacterium]